MAGAALGNMIQEHEERAFNELKIMIFANSKVSKNHNKKFELGRKSKRKKTFWSKNTIKSLDSLVFFRLSRVIGNKDLFLGLMQLKATCIINFLFKFDSVQIHSVF